ncbi:unnamed protein product, partial [Tilletia laevis]
GFTHHSADSKIRHLKRTYQRKKDKKRQLRKAQAAAAM